MTPEPSFVTFWLPLLLPPLLVFAVYRLTRLVVKDTFPPVLWVRDRLAGGWRQPTEGEWRTIRSPDTEMLNPVTEADGETRIWIIRSPWSPDWLAELITCPWCASGWITGCVIAVTDLVYGLPVPWLYGVGVWGAAALLASQEWA